MIDTVDIGLWGIALLGIMIFILVLYDTKENKDKDKEENRK